MGKTRDIANILGLTEADNTQNNRIADDSNDVTTLTTAVATSLIGDASTAIVTTEDSLPANPLNGKRAFVTSNQKFFVYDSPDWLNTLLINSDPSITVTASPSAIDSSGGTITVTITDSDFDQNNVLRSFTITPSNLTDSALNVTGSYDSSNSTITISYDSDNANIVNGSFKLTATVNDGISVVSDSASLSYDARGQSIILSANSTNVNEGDTVTYTLNTSGLENETINYTISGTGVTSADLSSGSLTGGIVITPEGVGSLEITFANDFATEGDEVFTLSIDAPYDTISTPSSVNVTVADTSLTPTVTVNRSASSVNEGSTCYFSCVTTNIPNNYRLYYKLGGISAADISSPSLSAAIGSEEGYMTVTSNAATSPTYTIAADTTTEGGENFYFYVTRVADTSGTTVYDINPDVSNFITINDTSISHPTGQYLFENPSPTWVGPISTPGPTNFGTFSWTVPAGTSDIGVAVLGGGGGGAGSQQGSYGGGGGGGGALGFFYVEGISAGQTYTVRVGKGGSGGARSPTSSTGAQDGQDGGTSQFFHQGMTAYLGAGGGEGGRTGSSMTPAAHSIGGNWFYQAPGMPSTFPGTTGYGVQYSGPGGAGGGWSLSPASEGSSGGGGGGAGNRVYPGNNPTNLPTSPDGYTGTGGEDGGGSDGGGTTTSGGGAGPLYPGQAVTGGDGGGIYLRTQASSSTVGITPSSNSGTAGVGANGIDWTQPGSGPLSEKAGAGGAGGGARYNYGPQLYSPTQLRNGEQGEGGVVIVKWSGGFRWS